MAGGASVNLNGPQVQKLKSLRNEYKAVFDLADGKNGRTNLVQHKIDTGDARPIRQSARRLPLAKK